MVPVILLAPRPVIPGLDCTISIVPNRTAEAITHIELYYAPILEDTMRKDRAVKLKFVLMVGGVLTLSSCKSYQRKNPGVRWRSRSEPQARGGQPCDHEHPRWTQAASHDGA